MQKIRLWEITPDQELVEMMNNRIPREGRLEDWLESDISVLAPNLLVIGRQVPTDYGGTIDLLCLDSAGNTVVVELKKGRTPREVTAQALDYASWAKDLSYKRLTEIADEYFRDEDSLASKYQERFEDELPGELNLNHHSLVVAEQIDPSTERIVRYLSDMSVPINIVTVQHFRDKHGREILAHVYLIDPEEAEAKAQSKSKRLSRNTLEELETMAHENGIGEMFCKVRDGVQGILVARPYNKRIWYARRIDNGRQRTVLIIRAVPDEEGSGLAFIAHATRFKSYLEVDLDELEAWLPQKSTRTHSVRDWSGSSPDERQNALGLTGSFQSVEEVDKFLNGLMSIRSRGQAQE